MRLTRLQGLLLVNIAVWIWVLGWKEFPIVYNFRDELSYLAGAYRLGLGQRPYLDFRSTLPPGTYYFAWLGTWLRGFDFRALLVGKALGFSLASASVFCLCGRRLRGLELLFLWALQLLMCFAPRYPLWAQSLYESGFAYFYNRVGCALLLSLLAFFLVQIRDGARALKRSETLTLAALILALFLLKQTFFLTANLILFVLWTQSYLRRKDLLEILGLELLGNLFLLIVWGFPWKNFLLDYWGAAAIRGRFEGGLYSTFVTQNWVFDIAQAFSVPLLLYFAYRALSPNKRLWAASALVVFLAHFFTNFGTGDRVLYCYFPLLFLSAASPRAAPSWSRWCLLAVALLLLPLVYGSARASLTAWSLSRLPESARPLDADARELKNVIEEGDLLLRTQMKPSDRLFVEAFTDYFSYRSGYRPSRLNATFWDFKYNFNAKIYPDPKTLYTDADLVLQQKEKPVRREDTSTWATLSEMERLYGAERQKGFALFAESAHWRLYRRKN